MIALVLMLFLVLICMLFFVDCVGANSYDAFVKNYGANSSEADIADDVDDDSAGKNYCTSHNFGPSAYIDIQSLG